MAQKLQKVYQKCNLCVQKLQGELGTFDRFVKTALYLSEWDFWLNCFFLWIFWDSSLFPDCGQKILQHWRRKIREVVESAFYLNNRTFRGKFVFWRKSLLLQIFWVLMKKSADFCRKSSARFEKLLSTLIQGYSWIPLSFSSRKFTPTNGLWGKTFGNL